LPGKIFEKIGDKSILEWVYEAATSAHRKLNAIQLQSVVRVIGPSNDEKLKEFCQTKGIQAEFPFAPEDDLILRYLNAAKMLECNYVVRITSDCWLHNPDLMVEVCQLFSKADYISNTIRRTFLEGLDIQACSLKALEWFNQNQKEEREHPFKPFDENKHIRIQFEKAGFKYTELLNPQNAYLIRGSSIDNMDDLVNARKWWDAKNQTANA
jgi:spore coat polysaccharide biosynthesis protein SpsF